MAIQELTTSAIQERAGSRYSWRRLRQVAGLGLSEARPTVQVMFTLRLAAGAVLAARVYGSPHVTQTVLAALAWWLAVVWAYLFNGVRDVHEDRANGSRRPIASGKLGGPEAVRMTAACGVGAVLGGIAAGGAVAPLTAAMVALGYLYSAEPVCLKRRLVGSPMFAVLASLMTYYAGYAAAAGGYPVPGRSLVIFAAAASLWTALVGSIAKDLPDVTGDAAAGRRTFTATRGEVTARTALPCVAYSVAGVFSVLAVTIAHVFLIPAVTAVTGATLVTAIGLSGLSRGSRSRRRRPYRAFMFTQYCVHILTVAAVVAA